MTLRNAKIAASELPDGRWDRYPDAVLVGDWLFFVDNRTSSPDGDFADSGTYWAFACLPSEGPGEPKSPKWNRVLTSPALGCDRQFMSWWRAVVRTNGPYPVTVPMAEAA
jgi:hypothetical protein